MSAAAPGRPEPVAEVDLPPQTPAAFQVATGCSDAELADVEAYLALLSEWNGKINLVGPSALAEFWPRHAFDSAQLLRLAPEADAPPDEELSTPPAQERAISTLQGARIDLP